MPLIVVGILDGVTVNETVDSSLMVVSSVTWDVLAIVMPEDV